MQTIILKTFITLFGFCTQMLIYQNLNAQNWESNFNYLQNTPIYNSAYAGIKTAPSVNFNYHHFEKNTNLLEAGFQTQLNKKPIGLGLSYIKNKYNNISINNFAAQFAYHFQLQQHIKLSAGIQLSLQRFYVDLSKLYFPNVLTQFGDTLFNTIDPHVDYSANANIATLLYSKKYYVGISIHNIVNQRLNNRSRLANNRQYKKLYFSGGIIFNEDANFAVKPSVLLNLNFESIIEYWRYTGFLDISVDALLYKTLWLGATFRPKQPLKLQAKIDFKQYISLLGYCQFIKNNFSFEKNYSFGLSVQARLPAIENEVTGATFYF